MRKKFFIFFFATIAAGALANGGDQRVLDGTYLVNLSRSPFTFRAGIENHMLISFLDVQKNAPINNDLIVSVRIARLAAPGAEPQFFFEKTNMKAEHGALEFPYTFAEGGFHEIYIDFAYASKPAEVHRMPDFLIEVQGAPPRGGSSKFSMLLAAFAGALLSLGMLKTFGFIHRK